MNGETRAVIAKVEKDRWMPLATAPEAERVFVWLPNYGEVVAYGTTDPGRGVRDWFEAGSGRKINPSHWRPRFKSPEQEAADLLAALHASGE